MKKINLILLLISCSIFSQEIKWNSVPNDKVNPSVLLSKGIIELENGDKTPEADLYIDFKNEKIFYRNIKSNGIYSIFKENFSKISVSDYKDGEFVKGNVFYGDVGEEIGASLRKGLYKVANLNIMKITSVEKEGFFNRKQPKFYINSNGELDVSNKAIVTSKILAITPSGIGYLDSEGDLWLRNNISTILSSLVDNTIFSLLAWIILNPNPESLYNVIMIYIFGTYILRIFIAFIDTPFMYFSKLFLPKNND